MALLPILHFPDERLRDVAKEVENVDADIRQLADDMLDTMYDDGGIGLAAIQVNVKKRIIVMDLSENKDSPKVLINPVIIESDGKEKMQEGCLSVPGFYEYVERAEHVKCQFLNLEGKQEILEADGLLAVCIQHEIDHLDGKLFIDYLSPLKQSRLKKKLLKQEKLQASSL